MQEVKQADLKIGEVYKVVTDQAEEHQVIYLGNQDVKVLPCNTQSFLIKSDKVYTVNQ